MVPEEVISSFPVCQLKTGDNRFPVEYATQITAAEWFSRKWPVEAERFGCPFLEVKCSDGMGIERVNPIALNEIFFAAILAGDRNLGHQVVFYTPDQQFYFRDPADGDKFKATTEAKLRTLLSMYILQCAEEMQDPTPKFNLFVRFRQDHELQKIVDKAKSLLSADKSFFSLESPNIRVEGAEAHGKAAKLFVSHVMQITPGRHLTVNESYLAFRDFCRENGLVVVDRRLFQDLIAEIVRSEFGLALRHDVPNVLGRAQRGWKGLGIRDLEPATVVLTEN